MQECPDKKLNEKLLFLEKRVVEITKCPEGKLDTLKHTLSHFKSDLKIKLKATNGSNPGFHLPLAKQQRRNLADHQKNSGNQVRGLGGGNQKVCLKKYLLKN
nr:unnamed protein product [Callosobruchus analis]